MENELDKSERIAARVYIRRRRKAWDHFWFIQDLKSGDFLNNKEGEIFEVVEVDSDYDASPLDIVVLCKNVKTKAENIFGFSIKAYEAQFMEPLLRWHNKGIRNSIAQDFKLNEQAKVLYGRKKV